NAFEPIMGWSLHKSISHLTSACTTLRINCVAGIEPNYPLLEKRVSESVTLATALCPTIGYERSARVAKRALANGETIAEAAEALGFLTGVEVGRLTQLENLTGIRK
ncbi:MAG: aspartate ammonia-lyase, partial [Pseudomonadota bacterium]